MISLGLLVAATGAVLLGTLYPLFLDALGMGKISVGPPYFEAVFVPLMTPVVVLMALGPFIRWKDDRLVETLKRLRITFVLSLLTAAAVPLLMGRWSTMAAFGVLLAAWLGYRAGRRGAAMRR